MKAVWWWNVFTVRIYGHLYFKSHLHLVDQPQTVRKKRHLVDWIASCWWPRSISLHFCKLCVFEPKPTTYKHNYQLLHQFLSRPRLKDQFTFASAVGWAQLHTEVVLFSVFGVHKVLRDQFTCDGSAVSQRAFFFKTREINVPTATRSPCNIRVELWRTASRLFLIFTLQQPANKYFKKIYKRIFKKNILKKLLFFFF